MNEKNSRRVIKALRMGIRYTIAGFGRKIPESQTPDVLAAIRETRLRLLSHARKLGWQ